MGLATRSRAWLREPGTAIVLMSAAGRLFTQETARRYAKLERLILICGRYEGVDERVAEHLATEEICVGDYVLSGGELPAAIVLDAVTRLLPGALGNEASTENESFSGMTRVARPWRVASKRARELKTCYWIFRITRARPNIAAGRCPMC